MAVEIPRYLADPEQGVTLRNGASVRVRAIRPDDEPRLMALCRRLSLSTVYQRFFSFRRLLPEDAHAFANVDYRQRMAVVPSRSYFFRFQMGSMSVGPVLLSMGSLRRKYLVRFMASSRPGPQCGFGLPSPI